MDDAVKCKKHRVRTKIKRKKMFNKGDKVSVLDEALNGVVLSTKGIYYRNRGRICDDIFLSMNCLKATIPVI
jgi:hypothetical protein